MNGKKRVLIVDDDPDISDVLGIVVSEAGFKIKNISDYDEVLPSVRNYRPHLIILDVLLEGRDARDLCRQLKNAPSFRDIPIVMISAHPDAKKSVFTAGCDDYIAKPFDVDEVVRVVNKYISH